MEIQKIPISQIIPHPDNPRVRLTPVDPVFRQIKKSYKTYGRLMPYVVNQRNNYCLSGHQRMAVDIAEGVTEAYVVFVDLDPEKEKGLMIALNSISGHWDNEKLSSILEEFTKVPDFDFESIGFTMPEVSQILDRYAESKDPDDYNFGAAIEGIKEPITKRGDIIELGRHRILCGDSSYIDDVKLLLGDKIINLVNTDFPYNVDYYGGNRPHANGRPKQSRQWERIYSDNMPQPEYEAWMLKVLTNTKGFLKPGGALYIWQGHRQIPPMYKMLLELGFHVASIICWLKESAAISYADYSFRTEHALYGWLEGAPHYFVGKPGESNVWEVKRDPTANYSHPTQKPVELANRAICNSSQQKDIVFDAFLGSGSTLIAAEGLGRRCFGLELDSKYCDAIVRRYANFVGADNISQDIRDKYLSGEVVK